MLIMLFIPTTRNPYTCHPEPFQIGLIKTLHAGSLPQHEVMRAEHATFPVYSGASVQTEACPPKQLRGFDGMENEGPSLPGVWYNESELTKHDPQLLQIRSRLKQDNKQHWFGSTFALAVHQVGGGGHNMFFLMCDSKKLAQDYIHSQPEQEIQPFFFFLPFNYFLP